MSFSFTAVGKRRWLSLCWWSLCYEIRIEEPRWTWQIWPVICEPFNNLLLRLSPFLHCTPRCSGRPPHIPSVPLEALDTIIKNKTLVIYGCISLSIHVQYLITSFLFTSISTCPSLRELLTTAPHFVVSQQRLLLYMSRELYTASCVLCCGVCWLLCTACGSFHKYLWPLWCYSQALCSVRRLHHNTCIPRSAVRGFRGMRRQKIFLWPFLSCLWFWCSVQRNGY